MAVAFVKERVPHDHHDVDEEPRLPGELPLPVFRRLHRHSYPANNASACRSFCTNSREDCGTEDVRPDMQEGKHFEEDSGGLLKVVERLDDIIERLMKSCKVKPQISLCMDVNGALGKEPFNSSAIEDHLDRIVQKLSQNGYFSRLSKENCRTPTKAHILNHRLNEQPLSSSSVTPSSGKVMLPQSNSQTNNESDDMATPTSSFRLPLLTPRSLLSKFGSSEKLDTFDSPTNNRRLSSSGGRSRRLSTAFSFLSSPKRVGALSRQL